MENAIEVIGANMKRKAILGNVVNVQYAVKHNSIWTCSFSLPYNDAKNEYCADRQNYIRIVEKGRVIGIFRVVIPELEKSAGLLTYQCEHVLATLVDNIMPGFHQIGNIGIYTRQVLEYVLQRQGVKRWKLGRCAFERQFEYGWDNENLLAALFSVPKPFASDYVWNWDTETYPWTIHLDPLDKNARPSCHIRNGKNLLTYNKRTDYTNLCTRLYCYGYGEGDNQLSIGSINNGRDYVDASADAIQKYGIIERVWVDRRFEVVEHLMARGRVLLDGLQEPHIEYDVAMADISNQTQNEFDRPWPGKVARLTDTDTNEDIRALILEVTKQNAFGESALCDVVLHNEPQDLAGSIADLADRQRIEQLYAQGATQIYADSVAENADANTAVDLRFYISDTMRIINAVKCKIRLSQFRAYSANTESGGNVNTGTSSSTSTSTGGGGQAQLSGGSDRTTGVSGIDFSSWQTIWFRNLATTWQQPTDPHSHTVQDFGLVFNNVVLPSNHQHTVDTKFTAIIPSHWHDMNHSHTVNTAHNHTIEPRIQYFGGANSFQLYVDGVIRGYYNSTDVEIDVTNYLVQNGTIARGQWHTISVKPNNVSRVEINYNVQGFIQSRGEGTY